MTDAAEIDDHDEVDLPANLPFPALLAWLTVRLGRTPTGADVARFRFALQEADRKKKTKLSVPKAARHGDSFLDHVAAELLTSPEAQFFLACLSALPLLCRSLMRDRWSTWCEWETQPSRILAHGRNADRFRDHIVTTGPQFVEGMEPAWEPSPWEQREALEEYVNAKLTRDGGNVWAAYRLDDDVVAGANAVTPDLLAEQVEGLRGRNWSGVLKGATARLGAWGRDARKLGHAVDGPQAGPPLGVIEPPVPPHEDELQPVTVADLRNLRPPFIK